METNWPASVQRRAWHVVVGYNLPFTLWTIFALFRPTIPVRGWSCPVQAAFHVCPSCGLTGAYTQLLRGNGIDDCWLGVVLGGFAANGIWSIIKAAKLLSNGGGLAGSI